MIKGQLFTQTASDTQINWISKHNTLIYGVNEKPSAHVKPYPPQNQ